MFENKKMEEESNSKKENENQISLQKLIKLDCRDSNFLFKDQLRNRYFKVHYPHTSTDLSPGEHLLKRFWIHVESHYFKKFQKEELYRLDYLKSIFNQEIQNDECRFKDQQFYQLLNSVFSEQVVKSFENEEKIELDRQNLVNRLYISWKKSQIKLSMKSAKNLDKKLTQSLYCLQNRNNKKRLEKSLLEEKKYLNQVLSWDFINGEKKQTLNQIQNQIQKFQIELNQIQNHNSKIIQKIQTFLQHQKNSDLKLPQKGLKQQKKCRKSSSKCKKSQIQTVSQEIHTNLQQQQIQFIIKNLQQRQLAESMAKILQCKKVNGQYYYLVSFQQAMYVQPKLYSQKQLIKLNKLRQTSMFMFYRTGVKSLYSYTCQSYAGFSQLAINRHNLAKYKPKDIFQMMKKTPELEGQTLATFNKFHTCHHCKFLYPDYLLKTCKFTSDRQALPKNSYEASLDPDFSQILHIPGQHDNKGRVSQRFTTRKKNCLTGYSKINQQYVCGRKYCYSCLKDCYPNDIMNDSIFCPFCQGNCTCSRCLRNQKIVKFKSTYTLLNGDLLKLSIDSCLQKLQNKQDNLVPKRRGRPKKLNKKIQHISINRVNKKLKNLNNSQLKLNNSLTANQRRITLSNKKDKVYKKRLILRQKCLTSLLPKRKRGRPPKNSTDFIKKSIKPFKNQVDQKQIENIFQSQKHFKVLTISIKKQ